MEGVDGYRIVGIGVGGASRTGGIVDGEELDGVHTCFGCEVNGFSERAEVAYAPVGVAAQREERCDKTCRTHGTAGEMEVAILHVAVGIDGAVGEICPAVFALLPEVGIACVCAEEVFVAKRSGGGAYGRGGERSTPASLSAVGEGKSPLGIPAPECLAAPRYEKVLAST